MKTLDNVQRIIGAHLCIPPASVRPDMRTSECQDWDSTRHLLIVMDLEQNFGFKFGLEEIAGLDSVDKIVKAIEKRAGQ